MKKSALENIIKFDLISKIEPFALVDHADDKNFGFLFINC